MVVRWRPPEGGRAIRLASAGDRHGGQADAVQRTRGKTPDASAVADEDAVLEAEILQRLARVTPRARDELYGDTSRRIVGCDADSEHIPPVGSNGSPVGTRLRSLKYWLRSPARLFSAATWRVPSAKLTTPSRC